MTPQPAPPSWTYTADGTALFRKFSFASYLEGMDACRKVAELAESLNHHPDLLLGYKTLAITWTTHSQGGVTEKDLLAAQRTNALLG
jgi:4a-hydroxytetrahydrobiopterin dehydratase